MLFGGKKERETEALVKRHVGTVQKVLSSLRDAAADYCSTCAEFDVLAQGVLKGESEADEIRRQIEHRLYDGAFMPIDRGDYARLVESVDKVANQCEAVAEFLLLTRPVLDDDTKQGLGSIMETTLSCYECITEMIERVGEGKRVLELAHRVEEGEQEVDEIYARTVSGLFTSDIDLARKLHVKMLLDRAAAVSNRIEDASDMFCVLVSKRPG